MQLRVVKHTRCMTYGCMTAVASQRALHNYIRLHPAPRRSAAEDYDVEEDGTIVVDNVEAENGYGDNDRI